MLFSLAFAAAASLPHVASAQGHWTGIGAINGTVMYMDTTSIQRIGSLRKVWIRSLDLSPKTVMVGNDSLTFDTVVALNVFDCSSGTRTVAEVRYLLGADSVFDVTNDHGEPEKLRPTSFFGAIYSDVCRSPGKSGSR
jgi:hypothetical protein